MALPTASDNKFPKVILTEGSAPSSPSAGDFKLYFDSADHLFKWKNSAGTVVTIATGTPFSDPMTTRGDIMYRNAANATARLAVGAAKKVLRSDGTDVSWGYLPTIGARAIRSTDQTGLVSAADTPVSFNGTDVFDTDAFHDPSGAPTKMTIPAGLSGTYLAAASITFDSSLVGTFRQAIFVKNGTTGVGGFQRIGCTCALAACSIMDAFPLVATDFLEVMASHDSGSNRTLSGSVVPLWFSLIRVGD